MAASGYEFVSGSAFLACGFRYPTDPRYTILPHRGTGYNVGYLDGSVRWLINPPDPQTTWGSPFWPWADLRY